MNFEKPHICLSAFFIVKLADPANVVCRINYISREYFATKK